MLLYNKKGLIIMIMLQKENKMGNTLSDLEPKKVFEFFYDLTQIPRSSGNEKAVSDYLVDFADKRGLIAYQDELNNVTMIKPATSGMEDKDNVILQAHIDMVAVRDEGVSIDPASDPLDVYVDGNYVKARGTSLGADDGIGVALILALLDSNDISHPMLEAVFTADEEVGLGGANGYDCSHIKGTRLINLDNEVENEIVNGCAGGCRCDMTNKCKNGKEEGNIYEIGISGLAGGHSGVEIHKGSANANVLMGRFLDLAMQNVEINLSTYEGGTKDNAICSAASALVVVKKKHSKTFEKLVKLFCEDVLAEYGKTDPDFIIKCKDKGKGKLEVISSKDLNRFVSLLNLIPNGVAKYSQRYDMVETSSNIGVVTVKPKSFSITTSLRSNIDASLDYMISKLSKLATAYGVQLNVRGRYPAWESRDDSEFSKAAAATYKRMFGKDIRVTPIHAGLECAVFSKKIKGMDAISIGPDLPDVHTTNEKLSIASTKRMWDYLLELVRL